MMSCSCDFDPCTIWRDEPRRARKAHRCSDCGGTITAGETYRSLAMLFDGEWSTAKRCADCQFMVHEVERTFMQKCGGTWCLYIGDLPLSWDDLMEGADLVDREQCRRIVGMQNAVAKARDGTRLWCLPLWMEPEE